MSDQIVASSLNFSRRWSHLYNRVYQSLPRMRALGELKVGINLCAPSCYLIFPHKSNNACLVTSKAIKGCSALYSSALSQPPSIVNPHVAVGGSSHNVNHRWRHLDKTTESRPLFLHLLSIAIYVLSIFLVSSRRQYPHLAIGCLLGY